MSDVEITRHGPVMLVEMNRPHVQNAIAGTLLADLAGAFDEARLDDTVRVVVTTGRGRHFSVGAHLPELLEQLDLPIHRFLTGTEVGGEKGAERLSEHQAMLEQKGTGRWAERMLALEKPTIAAINGSAAGGGLGIALLHDYRLASSDAKLTTAWTRVGVAPEMGATHLLPRIVGHRKAFDLVVRSPVLSADEAAEIGLVDEVVSSDELVGRALALADELARIAPLAAQSAKRLMRMSASEPLERMLIEEYSAFRFLLGTSDVRDTIRALHDRVVGDR